MGYTVAPEGRLHLPASDDPAAVAAVKAAWAGRPGWYKPGTADDRPADTLADIASYAAAALARDGDWVELTYDDEGDPKWSEQATAFYVAIAPFVHSGTVALRGEDDAQWSYTFHNGQISQSGWNGWDGSAEPFGEPVQA